MFLDLIFRQDISLSRPYLRSHIQIEYSRIVLLEFSVFVEGEAYAGPQLLSLSLAPIGGTISVYAYKKFKIPYMSSLCPRHMGPLQLLTVVYNE